MRERVDTEGGTDVAFDAPEDVAFVVGTDNGRPRRGCTFPARKRKRRQGSSDDGWHHFAKTV